MIHNAKENTTKFQSNKTTLTNNKRKKNSNIEASLHVFLIYEVRKFIIKIVRESRTSDKSLCDTQRTNDIKDPRIRTFHMSPAII